MLKEYFIKNKVISLKLGKGLLYRYFCKSSCLEIVSKHLNYLKCMERKENFDFIWCVYAKFLNYINNLFWKTSVLT
jgi:hypothetical protein